MQKTGRSKKGPHDQTEAPSYNVVLEGTGEPGSNHFGIRTWTTYASQAAFDNVRAEWMMTHQVIAEGVTDDEAVALCDQTPEKTRVAAAIKEVAHGAAFGDLYLANVLFALKRNPQSELRLADFIGTS